MAQRYVWTLQDLAGLGYQVQEQVAVRTSQRPSAVVPAPTVAFPVAPGDSPSLVTPCPRYRSKTEALYAERLAVFQHDGAVRWWAFEPLRLQLADRCTYTPDFLVQWDIAPWPLVCVEVKGGFTREDAWVKVKVAARQYAGLFRFQLATWKQQRWTTIEVSP